MAKNYISGDKKARRGKMDIYWEIKAGDVQGRGYVPRTNAGSEQAGEKGEREHGIGDNERGKSPGNRVKEYG